MKPRDRDKSVEQWLRQTPVPGVPADDCLDAETLAAWAEGVLDAPQRAMAEAHASNCARCQAMLAVMVRTTPAAAASAGSPLRKWLLMLGPPMAAAAAVALWFAVDQDRRTPLLDSLSKQQAKAEVESAPSTEIPQVAPPVPIEEDRKLPDASSDVAVQERFRAAPETLADARKERESPRDAAAPLRGGASVAVGNEKKKDVDAAKRVDGVAGADRIAAATPTSVASPPPPPPPAAPRPAESLQAAAGNRPAPSAAAATAPQQQATQAQNQAQNQAPNQNQVQTTAESPAVQRQQALEQRVIVADKPAAGAAKDSAAASRAEGRGGAAGGFADATASSLRRNVGDFEVAAASSAIRWRVVGGRTVQRSLDAGATWATQHTADSGVFFTAGTAPSSTVAWLVGRAGAIIVTRDGVSWERVTFPEVAELTSVVAPDARRATVTTVDGRRFATADGGRTWARQ